MLRGFHLFILRILLIGQFEIQNAEQFAALSEQDVHTNHTENTAVTNQKDFRIYKQSFQKGEIVL